jgi:hypothetical protein
MKPREIAIAVARRSTTNDYGQLRKGMKKLILPLTALIALHCSQWAYAQDSKAGASADPTKDAPIQTGAPNPDPTVEALETTFKETLTKATLAGRWCSIKEGVMGPAQEDKYTINSVTKLGGSLWLINASIQYGTKSIVAPIPVMVKWAGDTPVIIVEKIPVPGSGTYSARVMIFNHTYAGTWAGGDHGGLLNGVIAYEKASKASEPK